MESIFLLPKTKGVFDMELKAIQLTKQYGSKTAGPVKIYAQNCLQAPAE